MAGGVLAEVFNELFFHNRGTMPSSAREAEQSGAGPLGDDDGRVPLSLTQPDRDDAGSGGQMAWPGWPLGQLVDANAATTTGSYAGSVGGGAPLNCTRVERAYEPARPKQADVEEVQVVAYRIRAGATLVGELEESTAITQDVVAAQIDQEDEADDLLRDNFIFGAEHLARRVSGLAAPVGRCTAHDLLSSLVAMNKGGAEACAGDSSERLARVRHEGGAWHTAGLWQNGHEARRFLDTVAAAGVPWKCLEDGVSAQCGRRGGGVPTRGARGGDGRRQGGVDRAALVAAGRGGVPRVRKGAQK